MKSQVSATPWVREKPASQVKWPSTAWESAPLVQVTSPDPCRVGGKYCQLLAVSAFIAVNYPKYSRIPYRVDKILEPYLHKKQTLVSISHSLHTKAMAWQVVQLTSQDPSAKFQLTEPYEPALHTQAPSDTVVGQATALHALGVLVRSSLKALLHWKSSPATVLPAPVQVYEPLPLGMVSQAA